MAHAQYLTYAEYQAYGGALTSAAFSPVEFRCRKHIDRMTDTRVNNMGTVPEAVKLCMMSLINIDSKAGTEAQLDNPVVTSFNTDGYSESYGKALGVADADKSMESIIRNDLYGELDDSGTPLLYRGVI